MAKHIYTYFVSPTSTLHTSFFFLSHYIPAILDWWWLRLCLLYDPLNSTLQIPSFLKCTAETLSWTSPVWIWRIPAAEPGTACWNMNMALSGIADCENRPWKPFSSAINIMFIMGIMFTLGLSGWFICQLLPCVFPPIQRLCHWVKSKDLFFLFLFLHLSKKLENNLTSYIIKGRQLKVDVLS